MKYILEKIDFDDMEWEEDVPKKFKIGDKLLCKKTSQFGLTKGEWYGVVYNKNDNDNTFSILDDQNRVHLFYVYDDESDYTLPKWFYTKEELKQFESIDFDENDWDYEEEDYDISNEKFIIFDFNTPRYGRYGFNKPIPRLCVLKNKHYGGISKNSVFIWDVDKRSEQLTCYAQFSMSDSRNIDFNPSKEYIDEYLSIDKLNRLNEHGLGTWRKNLDESIEFDENDWRWEEDEPLEFNIGDKVIIKDLKKVWWDSYDGRWKDEIRRITPKIYTIKDIKHTSEKNIHGFIHDVEVPTSPLPDKDGNTITFKIQYEGYLVKFYGQWAWHKMENLEKVINESIDFDENDWDYEEEEPNIMGFKVGDTVTQKDRYDVWWNKFEWRNDII